MRNKLKIILIICLMMFAGCNTEQMQTKHLEKDVQAVTQVVNKSADDILKSSSNIDDEVISIKQNSREIKTEENSATVSNIESSANNIATESSKLKETSSNLSKAGVKLEISGRTIDDYVGRTIEAEKKNEQLLDENKKLKEDIKTGLNKMLKWIVGGCLIGAGACTAMALFFGNMKGGLFGAAACLIVMILTLAVGQYMTYIAIGGVAIIVISLGILCYQLFIQHKAISDNVWTQEVVKRNLPLELKNKLYGAVGEKGQAGIIQSKTTQRIVKQIKKKLPKGWKVVRDDFGSSS